MIMVQECWNAEESLVVGFETLARCHSRFLDDIGNSKDVQTTMELLKETFDTCMKGFEMHGLSERVDKGLEGMRVVMETSDCVQEGEEGGQPGIRMGICLQDVVYWLDVLERRVDAMLTKDDGVPDDESSGGAYMLWDISMADCLQENLDLLVCLLIC